MLRRFLTTSGLILLLMGCGGGSKAAEPNSTKNGDTRVEDRSDEGATQEPSYRLLSSDENNPAAARLEAFLKWYLENQTYVDGTWEGAVNKYNYSGPMFTFDQKMADKYIAILDSTGFFTPAFVSKQKQKFLAVKQSLIDEPINDGPPQGMDHNWLLAAQETPLFWDRKELPKDYVISPESDSTTAYVGPKDVNQIWFRLKLINGKWLIDESLGYSVD